MTGLGIAAVRLTRLWLTTALALVCTSRGRAQTIVVGDDRAVGAPTAHPLVEPYLAGNTTKAGHLLATAIEVARPDISIMNCVVYMTRDGETWTRHVFDAPRCADPWVTVLKSGTALFTGLVTLPDGKSNLFMYRSTDGGETWTDSPVRFGGGHDHEMLVVDTAGRSGGTVYLVSGRTVRNAGWNLRSVVYVARSTDDGRSFDSTQMTPSNLSFEAHTPAILSDGTLVIPFGDHHRWKPPNAVRTPRSWLVSTRDGGRSFSEPLFITEDCFGGGGWPSLAADAQSTRFRDRLYYVCARAAAHGIQLFSSADRGESWSKAKRVDQGTPASAETRIPMMAVNNNGVILVAWRDTRNDPAGKCMDVYVAASTDGAETFSAPTRVSSAMSCPQTAANDGVWQRWSAGGDYSGLVATPDGQFRLVWADSRSGLYLLRTAAIAVQ